MLIIFLPSGTWHCVKRTLPECGNYKLESYLPVYLWQQAMKKEGKNCFKELLNLLKKNPAIFQDQEDEEASMVSESKSHL